MIITETPEQQKHPHRFLMWDADENGKCVSSLAESEFASDIHLYYEQRAKEVRRLLVRLTDNEISPVYFFMDYQQITVKDLASRVRVSASTVKKHLTPDGFKKVSIEILQRYARVFDIMLADFFNFTLVPDDINVKNTRHNNRLLQKTTITANENNK